METHIPSLDLEAQAENFQLSAAVFPNCCWEVSNPRKKSIVTLTSDWKPLSAADKERGTPAEWFVGMDSSLGCLEISPRSICQTVSRWSCGGRVSNFRLILPTHPMQKRTWESPLQKQPWLCGSVTSGWRKPFRGGQLDIAIQCNLNLCTRPQTGQKGLALPPTLGQMTK